MIDFANSTLHLTITTLAIQFDILILTLWEIIYVRYTEHEFITYFSKWLILQTKPC